MFHHQKSSHNSSDDNLQINLLQKKQRQSRVNFIRANPHQHNKSKQNQSANINLINLKNSQSNINNTNNNYITTNLVQRSSRKSATYPRSNQFCSMQELYDTYSAFHNVDVSQSILTNPNNNNPVVGAMLFFLLVLFTPLETIALYVSEEVLELGQGFGMLRFLIVAELLAFGILYYFKWVQDIRMLKKYLNYQRKTIPQNLTLTQKILIRPYLLFLITAILTTIWQISYSNLLIQHESIQHLIVFYIIILPQIAGTLYFEQYLHSRKELLWIFYGVVVYFFIYGFWVSQWLFYGGVCGLVLIYLSIRVGRVSLLIQYISKLFMLIVILVYIYLIKPTQNQQYPQPFQKTTQQLEPDSPQSQIIPTIFLTLLSSTTIILVRCINNKILRIELYKYFYSDTFINNALLFIPVLLGFMENLVIDVGVGVIGCGVMFGVCYVVGKGKAEIVIDLDNMGNFGDDK